MKNIIKHIYIIGIIYALAALATFPKWTVDDAYISYRYADNLANHSELTWNVGEDPIEGYTGIAMPVIMSIFIKLGLSPIIVGKVIGVVFFLLGGLILRSIFRLLKIQGLACSIPLILYFTAPFMFVHALSGMETILFSTIIVICVYLLFISITTEEHKGLWEIALFVLLLLTSLVRPEGVVLALTTIAGLVFIKLKYSRREFPPFTLRVILVYVIPGLIYFIWRWHYYGQFLPNTFYVKSSPDLFDKFSVLKLAFFSVLFLFIPAVGCLILNASNIKKVRAEIREWIGKSRVNPQLVIAFISIIVFVGLVLLQYMRSRLLMNFEYRFYSPFFPIFLIFAGILLHRGISAYKSVRRIKPVSFRFIGMILVLLLILQSSIYYKELKKYIFLKAGYKRMIEDEHIPAGEFLRENVPPSEWSIVIHDIGAIPYYSGLKTVDFSRLNNEELARGGMSKKEIIDYFYSFNAGAVVITSYKPDEVHQPWIYGDEAAAITADPRFERYELVKKYKADVSPDHPAYNYFEFVYLRKDLCEDFGS
ncbi:MAG: hypothetical protein HQ591_10000 [candidate division Zixibacteria bacterium]|nr:hypothetical protein [Candidatus Tariuqbacter arcticus]